MTSKQAVPDTGLVQATKALGAAMDRYRKAAEVAEIATNEHNAALIELNSCQERVDNAVADMMMAAPPGSRWRGGDVT